MGGIMGPGARDGLQATAPNQVSFTLTADTTDYDLFDGDTTIGSREPDNIESGWVYCEFCIDVDLSDMIAGDSVIVDILKTIDGTNFESVSSPVQYDDVQNKKVKNYRVEANTNAGVKAVIQRSGGSTVVVEVVWWALGF